MNGRSGIASLLVLWAMLLLGTLALSFSLSMRTEAQAARNGLDGARAYYQARSGISRAMALLSTLPPDNVAAMAIEGRDGDADYAVRILPESGKVDIDSVPEATLKAILKKGGLSEEGAEALGDAILDWRDADDDRRPRGAEAVDYANLPEPVRPRNGKTAAIEELQYVKGIRASSTDSSRRCSRPTGPARGSTSTRPRSWCCRRCRGFRRRWRARSSSGVRSPRSPVPSPWRSSWPGGAYPRATSLASPPEIRLTPSPSSRPGGLPVTRGAPYPVWWKSAELGKILSE